MNRNSAIALAGVGLLGVGIVAGVLLAVSTVPPYDPLPVTTHLTPPDLDAAPRPDPTYTRPPGLNARILEDGDVVPTREELIAFARDNAWMVTGDPVEWGTWNALIVACMAEKGFWYDPRLGLPNHLAPEGFLLALSGPGTGAGDAYRWQDAGCGGWATHELGIGS